VASIKQLIINERQRALFVEGFRNYDIQRFNIPSRPPPEHRIRRRWQLRQHDLSPAARQRAFNNPAIGG